MNRFTNAIIIPDDDDKIIDTSTVEGNTVETPVNIIDDETDSNLTNEETGSQDDFNLADNIWNTDTEELQEPNNQILHESDGWNIDMTDELQESNNQ
ncbi:18890_t:CDS:2, partial [Dentiscutata erythropus]